MAVPSTPLFGNPTRVTADAVIKASPGKLWAIMLVGGTAPSSMAIHNDVDSAGGTQLIDIKAGHYITEKHDPSTVFISFVELGGIAFDTGMYVNWEGTGAVGYVWFS